MDKKKINSKIQNRLAFIGFIKQNIDTMFTGIIQEIGTIAAVQEKNGIKTFSMKAPKIVKLLKIGDSVSVDGACLTVISKTKDSFKVEAIPETLKLTIANEYKKSTQVNLEPAMQMQDRFHGHFVSGHIDFTAKVTSTKTAGDSIIFTIDYPQTMKKFFGLKGSVTVNGVSLTISKITEKSFEVSLIPHTLKNTNLQKITNGTKVNVEFDLLARYLKNLL